MKRIVYFALTIIFLCITLVGCSADSLLKNNDAPQKDLDFNSQNFEYIISSFRKDIKFKCGEYRLNCNGYLYW